MNIRYCIRTCTARVLLASNLYDKLRELTPPGTKIDIINDYIGRKPIKIFGNYLKHLKSTNDNIDLLVTLEDDAVLNENIHSNILSSPILEEIDILGCIQLSLFSANDLREPTTRYDYDYDCFTRETKLHYSCGLVFTRTMLNKMDSQKLASSDSVEFDIEMTQTCLDLNLLLAIHFPALVASIPNIDSTLGNKLVPFDDIFSKTWIRTEFNNERTIWKNRLKHIVNTNKMMNM